MVKVTSGSVLRMLPLAPGGTEMVVFFLSFYPPFFYLPRVSANCFVLAKVLGAADGVSVVKQPCLLRFLILITN